MQSLFASIAGPGARVVSGDSQYFSSSKLLLRPPSQALTLFGEKVEAGATDTRAGKLWFTDFNTVRDLFSDSKFLERIRKKIPSVFHFRSDAELRSRMMVFSSSVASNELVDLSNSDDPEEVRSHELRKGVLQMITLSIWEDSPEKSQILARLVTDEFLAEMKERASREFTERRLSAEELAYRSQSEIHRLESDLSRPVDRLHHAEFLDLERNLSVELNRLELEKSSVSSAVVKESESASRPEQPTEVQQALDDQEMKTALDEKVYQPGSQLIHDDTKRLEDLRNLRQELSRHVVQSESGRLDTLRQATTVHLKQLNAEIDDIRSIIHVRKKSDAIRKLELALTHWQETYLRLIPSLYTARVSERQAQSMGALIEVQKPLIGTALKGSVREGSRIAVFLACLPISLGIGCITCIGIDLFYRSRSVFQEILDAGLPILAVVERFPPNVTRSWQELRGNIRKKRSSLN